MSVEADAEPRAGLDPKFLGFVLVTLAAWNVAFVARERFGIFTSVGAVAAVCLVRGLGLRTPWRELLRPRRDAVVVSLAATALLVGATALLRGPILHAWPWLDFHARALYLLFGEPDRFQGWVMLPAIAAGEELIFRGAMQSGLEARLGRWPAMAIAVAIYACGHLASRQPALIGLAVLMGAFWGALRARTQSLWPGIVSHVIWDLFIVVWSPLQ